MVMDFMLSMGSGLGLSSCVEDQHQVCTSLHYSQLQKKIIVAIRILPCYIEKPRWMWKREIFDWDGIYQYTK